MKDYTFDLRWLTRTAILLGITLAFQMLGLPQMFTGPAVNAMLLLSSTYVGSLGAVIIGLLTPFIAFTRGILAPPLAPMIPFIMLGNAIFVISYVFIRQKTKNNYMGKGVGLILGAICKFLILSLAVQFIVNLPPPVSKAMQIPQLYTAVVGGIIAIIAENLLDMAIGKNK